MKVWQLVGRLLWHLLHGRGGDDVFLYLTDLPEAWRDHKNWTLADIGWTGDQDRFVILSGTPEVSG